MSDDANRWRGTGPELTIAAVAVAAAMLAGGALAGWAGVATVAIGAAALSMVVLRGLLPRSAAQSVRRARDKQDTRAIAGYAQRRFVVVTSTDSRAFYEARFSSHPLGSGQRDAAKAALDELAVELHGGAEART